MIGCIPLSAEDAYTYLGSTRLRICFIDFTATSGGSTFAALLLCAVVVPSLLAVSICYSQIFVTARVQAQRIYDIELAAVAAGRRVFLRRSVVRLYVLPLSFFFCIELVTESVTSPWLSNIWFFAGRRVSPTQTSAQPVECPPSTTMTLIQVAPCRQNGNDLITEVEEGQATPEAARKSHSQDVGTNANGKVGGLTEPTSSSTQRRSRALWQSAMNGAVAETSQTTPSADNSESRWQRTITKVTRNCPNSMFSC